MSKLRPNSSEEIESINEILCEQYLPRVFQYVSYWVSNTQLAEELTLKALKKALVTYKTFYKQENTFSIGVFATARKGIRNYLQISGFKPSLPDLSSQEQEVISLKLGARLNIQRISKILGLSKSNVSRIIYQSLCKLNGCLEVPK